jgi:uncharacterized LabA/DUF88 family protein
MDLLHSERFDGFCLVSSDSDFTRLASRLREEGADVYGFGARKTPESFRQACRRFIYTENLIQDAASAPREGAPAPQPAHSPGSAIDVLSKAVAQMDSEDGWVGLRALGQRLANVATDFDPRSYGFRNLSDLVRQSGAFEIDESEGRAMRVRAKSSAPAGPRSRRRRSP